jgi:hypothetical protein
LGVKGVDMKLIGWVRERGSMSVELGVVLLLA